MVMGYFRMSGCCCGRGNFSISRGTHSPLHFTLLGYPGRVSIDRCGRSWHQSTGVNGYLENQGKLICKTIFNGAQHHLLPWHSLIVLLQMGYNYNRTTGCRARKRHCRDCFHSVLALLNLQSFMPCETQQRGDE